MSIFSQKEFKRLPKYILQTLSLAALSLAVLSLLALIGIVHYAVNIKHHSILFESLESKTIENKAVFNRVRFVPGLSKDLWFMQQSHHGNQGDYQSLDRLAIEVDKTQKPYVAKFYQLTPGKIPETERLKPVPLKATCFSCHPNGPRAIRKKSISKVGTSIVDNLRIGILNFRIKSYGKVLSKPAEIFSDGRPFKAKDTIFETPLQLESCNGCHGDSGIRSGLTVEHIPTITFLIKEGEMPPFPFKIDSKDRKTIERMGSWR